jgi:hypothetical protein
MPPAGPVQKGTMNQRGFELEDIEALRQRQGIDDVELREAIGGLRVGHVVRLTFRTEAKGFGGETLRVQVTRIRGHTIRGKLVQAPVAAALANLGSGVLIDFTAAHVHSILKGAPVRAPRSAGKTLSKE